MGAEPSAASAITYPTPVLSIHGLSKTFGATKALSEVDLDLFPRETHALIGQNGSGKSTLIKVLSGYHQPDPGSTINVCGEPWRGGGRKHDRIRFVHQDLGLVLALNAIDNLAMHGGTYSRGMFGRIRWRQQEQITTQLLSTFGVEFDVRRPLSEVTPVQRVVVAIAAALQSWDDDEGVLVLDEPTAVMTQREVARLFAVIERLKQRGVSVLYVSHRLDEVFEIADRVTVLRNGDRIGTCDVPGLSKSRLVSMMLGRSMEPDYRAADESSKSDTVVLEVKSLQGRELRDVSLTIRQGEVVGVAGLAGSGREELASAVAGTADNAVTGHVRVPSRSNTWSNMKGARSLGVALVPADRATQGIVAQMSISENLSLSVLSRLRKRGKLSRRLESTIVGKWLQRLEVKMSSPQNLITTLSGGNQQKVLIGRCLATEPAVLVLSEPTAGVDIGARRTIYDFLAEQTANGLSILVSSSDVGDLVALCSRVLVIKDGVIAEEIRDSAITEHAIVHSLEGTMEEVA